MINARLVGVVVGVAITGGAGAATAEKPTVAEAQRAAAVARRDAMVAIRASAAAIATAASTAAKVEAFRVSAAVTANRGPIARKGKAKQLSEPLNLNVEVFALAAASEAAGEAEIAIAIAAEGIDMVAGTAVVAERASVEASARVAAAALTEADENTTAENKQKFAGINFGVGIGIIWPLGVESFFEAKLVPSGDGQIVRASSKKVDIELLLETHYFLTSDWENFGTGPFFAVQPATDSKIIEGAGIGWMIGLRGEEGSQSFNVGVGLYGERDVETLGGGLENNKPLPEGDMLRTRTRSLMSLLLITSFAF